MTSSDKRKKVFALCASVMISVVTVLLLSPQVSAKDSDNNLVIVSMGDSYSSGEGNEDFYGQTVNEETLTRTEKAQRNDWISHRSTNSWAGMLKFSTLEGKLKSHYTDIDSGISDGNWYFVASSGAQSFNITPNAIEKEYNSKGYKDSDIWEKIGKVTDNHNADNDYRQRKNIIVKKNGIITVERKSLPYQVDILSELSSKGTPADYVTISIGGNDVGFGDLITAAVMPDFGNFCEKCGSKIKNWFSDIFSSYNSEEESINYLDFEYALPSESNLVKLMNKTYEDYLDDGSGEKRGILYNRLLCTYRTIIEKSGNPDIRIIVLGYPRLLDPKDGGLIFSNEEAAIVNGMCEKFDNWLKFAIEDLESDLKHEFPEWTGGMYYSSVLDEFGTEHLSSSNNEDSWIYPLKLTDAFINTNIESVIEKLLVIDPGSLDYLSDYIENIQDSEELYGWGKNAGFTDVIVNLLISQYTMHPNKNGVQAYAKCAQNTVDDVEYSIRGKVVQAETGKPISGAAVRIYKCEEEENDKKTGFSFIEMLSNFYYSNISKNNDDDLNDQKYANSETDDTNLIAEYITDSDGKYEALLLPELEEDELYNIKVSVGGYSTISYYTNAKRYSDCINTKNCGSNKNGGKVKYINEDGTQSNDEMNNEFYYRFCFEMEEQDVEKMLCGTWQSNSLHWSLPAIMTLEKDGSCSLDYSPMYTWSVSGNTIIFKDTTGYNVYNKTCTFEITKDRLIIYNTEGTDFINGIDEGEKAVYYKQ